MQNLKTVVVSGLILLGTVATALAVNGAPEEGIPYQGTLQQNGVDVSATVAMDFALYDSASDGTQLWTQPAASVTVNAGTFSYILGSDVPLTPSVFLSAALFVEISVDGTPIPGRQQIFAAHQAVRASEVGVGTIVAHTTHLAGSATLAQMKAAGFAECNGTNASSQGITGAVITDSLPDLNGSGRFLRGAVTSGTQQGDSTARNGIGLTFNDPGHDHPTPVSDNCGQNNGSLGGWGSTNMVGPAVGWQTSSCLAGKKHTAPNGPTGISVGLTGGDAETRPVNMSVIWMMRVR